MCTEHGACTPCEARRAVRETPLVAVEQAEREVVVWGPASVEVETRDGYIFSTEAVEQALPQLLRRRTVDLLHRSAFGVGEVLGEVRPDPARMPVRAPLKRVVEEAGGVLRSGVYEVSQAIADLFPRLKPVQGTRQVFLASRIFGDNDTARQAQQDAIEGRLDSYSIAGVGREVEQAEVCGPGGCREVQRVLRLDLHAVTLCGALPRPEASVPQAKNPLAAFVVVQMAASPFLEKPTMPHAQPSPSSPPAVGAPVEQADDATTGDPLQRLETALVEQGRRIEQLEQTVAELRATRDSSQEEAAEDAGTDGENDESDNEESPEDESMPNDQQTTKKPDEKPVEQANTPASDAAPPAWFSGYMTTTLPTLIEQAVEKQLAALGIKAAPIEQAATAGRASVVQTPHPATAPTGHAPNPDAMARLVEAAETGDPTALADAFRTHGPAAFSRRTA